jgi:hypothetical protein
MIIHILNNLDTKYEMEVKMLEHEMQQLKETNKENLNQNSTPGVKPTV